LGNLRKTFIRREEKKNLAARRGTSKEETVPPNPRGSLKIDVSSAWEGGTVENRLRDCPYVLSRNRPSVL